MTEEELTPLRDEVVKDLDALINKGLPVGFTFNTFKTLCTCRSCQGAGCDTCHNTGFNLTPPPTP